MKIAILGGRFDPPHIGHYLVARQVKDYVHDVSEVLLVPAFEHQWKKTDATASQRLEMAKMLEGNGIRVSGLEIERKGVSYSIDTIKEMKKQTGKDVYWIVGSDILHEFDKWEKKDELVTEATFLVFPRDPYHLPVSLPKGFTVLDTKDLITTNFSSTVIRKRIEKGLSITNFVLDDVEEYILKHGLYTK